jgi:hypothetical protein
LREKTGITGKKSMPINPKKTPQPGYVLERVTIYDLFESGETHEPSEKALRARAARHEGILVFVESVGNTHYYDKMLSTIRANAARQCKGPGVQWKDIAQCLRKVSLTNEHLKVMLNNGQSREEVTEVLAKEITSLLDQL